MVIVTALIVAVLAYILRQLFLLKQKVDDKKVGEQQKDLQNKKEFQSGNIMTVFEQIKANQEKLQKDMEKVQMQIDNSNGELQQQSTKGHQSPGLEQIIQKNQLKIQEDVAKVQVQIEKYGDILKLLQNTDCFKLKPIRKSIRFVIENCAELFQRPVFQVNSVAIEVLGFRWYLKAMEKSDKTGFLSLYLSAIPPSDHFDGHYRIEVDFRLSVLNAYCGKDLAHFCKGEVYTNTNCYSGWGKHMGTFEVLLDPSKGFLRPDGSIEVEADFTIKSSTLDHLI